ncbi:MAG: hypothetical protein HZC02_04540 [Candidatus Levybacteria bacterium]|nr:hypothetical protein [Candidatus Levybacteria bacterium]
MRLKHFLLISPFVIIAFFNRTLLFGTSNPSWGDMVAMPPSPLPFWESMLHVWRDIFTGGFGPTNVPHLILSQFSSLVPLSVLQGAYLFLLFPILFVSFIDILKQLSIKKSWTDPTILLEANFLVLIIYFSNTFLVNFIQGNPDVYYGYLLGIPSILYLYLFLRKNDFISGLKMVLLITIASWFGSFSFFYLAVLLFPFFILFFLLYRKNVSIKSLFLLFVLFLACNASLLFATIKPILDAVSSIGGATGKEIIDTSFSLYKGMNPLQLFYFAGNFGDVTWLLFNIPGGHFFMTLVFYPIVALQIIIMLILAYSATSTTTKTRQKQLIFGLFGIYIFFFTLLLIWDTEFFSSIARNIPMIALYRNPKKVVLSLYVAYILVIIFVKPFIKASHYKYSLLGILLLTAIPTVGFINDGYNGLKNAYVVSSAFYHKDEVKSAQNFERIINFPNRFIELKKYLREQDDKSANDVGYRLVVLPDNSQTLYQGQLFYLLSPFYININAAVFGQLKDPVTIMNVLYTSLINGNSSMSTQLLQIANVKYVVIDRQSSYDLYISDKKPQIRTYYGTFTSGHPEEFKKLIDQHRFLKLVKTNQNFYVYQNLNYKNTFVYAPEYICNKKKFGVENDNCDYYESLSAIPPKSNKALVSNLIRNNPTDYSFVLKADAAGKKVIFFNQTFDRFWSLIGEQGSNVKVSEHRIGNFYGNSWTIEVPNKGEYLLKIKYKLEQPYRILVFFSTLSILGTISLMVFLSLRRRGI